MDKEAFYHELQTSLSIKYGTPYYVIRTIRSFAVGYKWTQEEINTWIVEKLLLYQLNKWRPKQKHLDLLDFLRICTPSDWKDITQITKFDTDHTGKS